LDFQLQPFTVAGQKPTPEAEERHRFVEECLWGMRGDVAHGLGDFNDAIYDILDAFGKGLSVVEPHWERHPDGSLRPRGVRWLRPVHFDYQTFSDETERLMLDVRGDGVTLEDFPAHRFLVSNYRSRSAALAHHTGVMRKLAPWWIFSNFATDWLLQFGQLFGIPIRWASYNEANKGQMGLLVQALKQMGTAGYAAFPEGVNLQLFESKVSASTIPQKVILDTADELADLHILGQTLTSKPGANGNRSLGEIHDGVRSNNVNGLGEFAAKVVSNQLIPAILWWNYGDTEMAPRLCVESEDEDDEKAAVERDKVLFVDMGLPVTNQFLYERHNVPPPQPSDELFEKPTPPPALGAIPGKPPVGREAKPPGKAKGEEVAFSALSPGNRKLLRTFGVSDPGATFSRFRAPVAEILAASDPDKLEIARAEVRRRWPNGRPADRTAAHVALGQMLATHHAIYRGGIYHGGEGIAALAEFAGSTPDVAVVDLSGLNDEHPAGEPPADVVEALGRMPEEARDHYIARLDAQGFDVSALRYNAGSGHGGRFKARTTGDAQAAIQGILEGTPTYGTERGRRRVIQFGLKDGTAEWTAVGGRIRHADVTALAAKVKRLEEIPLDDMLATQRTVDGERMLAMMEAKAEKDRPKHQSPIVVRRDGRLWLYDGHHTAAVARMKGEGKLKARLVNLDDAATT
jgi:hypothetical protein